MTQLPVALRSLVRSPVFSLMVITTLALTLGVTTAVFSVVHGVLLEALPYQQPDRLVTVTNHPVGNPESVFEVAYPSFRLFQGDSDAFTGVTGFATSDGGLLVDFGDQRLERVPGKLVAWNFFRVLGVEPILGRDFGEEDDLPGAAPTTVIAESLWRSQFGGERQALGRTVEISGTPHTVIGVVRDLDYPDGARMWAPVAVSVPQPFLDNPQLKFFNPIGRLAPGVSLEQAEERIQALQASAVNPGLPESAHTRATLDPFLDRLLGDVRGPLGFLLGAALVVFLVACANVANLQWVRAIARQRELAVRSALGAGRGRLVALSLLESSLLAAGGGLAGLVLAALLVTRLPDLLPEGLFRAEHVGLHPPVLAFMVALTGAAALLFGLVPALWSATWSQPRRGRGRLAGALQAGGRGSAGPASGRWLSASVVVQVASGLVLLLGAGLLLTSFVRLQSVDVGFDRQGVLTLAVPLQGAEYQDPQKADALYDELVTRATALPGVEAAGGVLLRPLHSLVGFDAPVTLEGRPEEEQAGYPLLNYEAATPGYFRAMGVPLLEGRVFTAADREESSPVAVVSRATADRLWPEESPVGRRFKFGGPESPSPWVEVVGVVATGRYRQMEVSSLDVFVPHRQSQWPLNHLAVRTAGDPATLVPALRRSIRELDPALRPVDVATTGQMVSRSLAAPRFHTLLLGIFATLALVLGAVGLYGVMAYIVTLRRREIGIRFALGADRRDALGRALRRALALVLGGIGLGLVTGWLLARALEATLGGVLYQVRATDPLTFLVVPLVLLAVGLTAALRPALAASRVDPGEALRAE